MTLSVRQPPYVIPSYSLTGDLLAYRACGLQYRYHNRGSLPPSTPVQLWFGEFIHGVMEEAYLRWNQNRQSFPWYWNPDIRAIEIHIDRRLRARGLYAPPNLFDRAGTNQLIASQRAEASINIWGPHLFPLIADAEVWLKGIRPMLKPPSGKPRADYYEIQGVVDVIGSVQLANAPSGNLILHYLHNNPQIQREMSKLTGTTYEIIIDYKGMRRPNLTTQEWQDYERQILTYAWLRSQQPRTSPVIAGILLFLNELVPSREDIKELYREVKSSSPTTDIVPIGPDLQALCSWQDGSPTNLSQPLREQRSIRIIPIAPSSLQASLQNFDSVVEGIEDSVIRESSGGGIINCWQANPARRRCTACDFKTFCLQSKQPGPPTAP